MKDNKMSKAFIVPVVLFSVLLLIVIGTSFAYYAFVNNATNQANFTVTMPEKVDKSSKVEPSSCELIVDYSKMDIGNKSNTTARYTTDCYLNVVINGAPGDYCTYNIAVAANGTGYTKASGLTLASGTYEFSGIITKTADSGASTFKSEAQINTIATGTAINGQQNVVVGSGNSTATDSYKLTLKYYNLDVDQTVGLTNEAQNYQYYLKLLDISCNFNH